MASNGQLKSRVVWNPTRGFYNALEVIQPDETLRNVAVEWVLLRIDYLTVAGTAYSAHSSSKSASIPCLGMKSVMANPSSLRMSSIS